MSDSMLSYTAESPQVSDAAIAARVEYLKNLTSPASSSGFFSSAARPNRSRWLLQCRPSAQACLCSQGCPTSWLSCRPSWLCGANASSSELPPEHPPTRNVAVLLYLTFRTADVRHKYAAKPWHAYRRELRRITWFLHTARRENVTLPIHVVVAGDRNVTAEAGL
eukprot:3759438-Prymnesium_polylepis.1